MELKWVEVPCYGAKRIELKNGLDTFASIIFNSNEGEYVVSALSKYTEIEGYAPMAVAYLSKLEGYSFGDERKEGRFASLAEAKNFGIQTVFIPLQGLITHCKWREDYSGIRTFNYKFTTLATIKREGAEEEGYWHLCAGFAGVIPLMEARCKTLHEAKLIAEGHIRVYTQSITVDGIEIKPKVRLVFVKEGKSIPCNFLDNGQAEKLIAHVKNQPTQNGAYVEDELGNVLYRQKGFISTFRVPSLLQFDV